MAMDRAGEQSGAGAAGAVPSAADLDQITDLHGRITAALDRIAAASAVQAVAGASAEDVAQLEAALASERAAREAAEADLAAAQEAAAAAPPPAEPEPAPSDGEVSVLRNRAARFRDERNALRDERDELADRLDAALAAAGSQTAAEPSDLVAALRQLRLANADLIEQCAEMRDKAPDAELLNAALASELAALKAERQADAAEMAEILSALPPLTGTEHA